MSAARKAPTKSAKRPARSLSDEELRAAIRRHTKVNAPKCGVQLRIKPDPVAHDLYRRMIHDGAVPSRVASDVIAETTGIRISSDMFERHRAGECVHCAQEEQG